MKTPVMESAAQKAASFLLPLAQQYRASSTTEQERRYLFKVAKWSVREFEPYFIGLKCSKAAADLAGGMGLSLTNVPWAKRDTIKIAGKKAFHYEHLIEVAAAAHELVVARNIEEIASVLTSQQVAWITIAEWEALVREDKARRIRTGQILRDKHNWLATLTSAEIDIVARS